MTSNSDLLPVDSDLAWQDYLVERGDPLNRGLAALFVINSDHSPRLVGTAFLVNSTGRNAIALTAAHCMEEISKVLNPHPLHHRSALSEFLPIPKEVVLDKVKALHFNGQGFSVCQVSESIWDNSTDFAILTLESSSNEPDLFQSNFWINSETPEIGEDIFAVGYGEMQVNPNPTQTGHGTISLRLVARCGKVEAVHTDGHYMLNGPHIQTSIAVYSGMSGGVVARIKNSGTRIEPFALISHAPEPQPTLNEQSGQSVAALLNAEKHHASPDGQTLKINVTNIRVGRKSTPS